MAGDPTDIIKDDDCFNNNIFISIIIKKIIQFELALS